VTTLCVSVLLAAETAAVYMVTIALFTPQPSKPTDTDQMDTVALGSALGGSLAVLSLTLTALLVGVDWLRPRWLVPPAVVLAAALVRYHLMPQF
jgi:hypothetical protein